MVNNKLLSLSDFFLIFNLHFIAVYCQYDLIHMLLICANTRDTPETLALQRFSEFYFIFATQKVSNHFGVLIMKLNVASRQRRRDVVAHVELGPIAACKTINHEIENAADDDDNSDTKAIWRCRWE